MKLLSAEINNYRLHKSLSLQFDPRCTLIGGPNESGKSTVAEAIHRALFLKGKVSGEITKSMTSLVHGGNPEVHVTFELGGKEYTVTKRFHGTSGSSQLRQKGGATWQNEEAEEKLSQLLQVDALTRGGKKMGDRLEQQWGHLWVWQGKSGSNPSIGANDQFDNLMKRLKTEGGGAALLSDQDSRVAKSFVTERDKTYTQRGAAKAGSELARCEDRAAETENLYRTAVEKMNALEETARSYSSARGLLGTLTEKEKETSAAWVEAKKRLKEIQNLQLKVKDEEKIVEKAESVLASLFERNDALEKIQESLNKLTTEIEPEEKKLKGEEALFQKEKQCLEELEKELVKHRAEADQKRGEERFLQAWIDLVAKERLKQELEGKIREIKELQDQDKDLRKQLIPLAEVSENSIASLRKLDSAFQKAAAELSAMAARIEVVRSGTSVSIDGVSLSTGDSHIISEAAELQIGTDVTLRISPGGGAGLSDLKAAYADSKKALDDAMETLGVKKVEDAHAKLSRKNQLESKAESQIKLLKSLSPDKTAKALEECEAEISKLDGVLSSILELQPEVVKPEDEKEAEARLLIIEEAIRDNKIAVDFGDKKRAELKGVLDARELAIGRLRSEAEKKQWERNRLEKEMEALTLELGDKNKRQEALLAAENGRNEARKSLQTLQHRLEELGPDHIQLTCDRLENALTKIREQINDNRVTLKLAEDKLVSSGREDPQVAVREAEANRDHTLQHLNNAKRKAEAVKRLADLFEEKQQKLAEQFTQPLAERITRYLRLIFGSGAEAKVSMEENNIRGIELHRPSHHNTDAFDFEVLSGGAKEQVATAVRLAMAEVLASEFGGSLPLVFDDAFAYSDGERVKAIYNILFEASRQGLQIIVLSCYPQDYADLGASTIMLNPA